MERVQNGEWIEVIVGKYEGEIGMVEQYFPHHGCYQITFPFKENPTLLSTWKVKKAPLELHREDFQAMINLALDTKDEKWFKKLIKRVDRANYVS